MVMEAIHISPLTMPRSNTEKVHFKICLNNVIIIMETAKIAYGKSLEILT